MLDLNNGLHKSKRIAFHTRMHVPALQLRKDVNTRNEGGNGLLHAVGASANNLSNSRMSSAFMKVQIRDVGVIVPAFWEH